MAKRAAALVVFVLMTLLAGSPALAHGGPIKLEVSGDGGQGVNTTVRYINDDHMVTDEVKLSYTAVTADGKTLGPVRMIASNEGQAFYHGETPLPLGNWTVTVTATHPSAAQKTVAVTSAALPVAAPTTPAASSSLVPKVLIVLAIMVVAILATTVIVLRRRTVRRTH
jgi:hypothetical protein